MVTGFGCFGCIVNEYIESVGEEKEGDEADGVLETVNFGLVAVSDAETGLVASEYVEFSLGEETEGDEAGGVLETVNFGLVADSATEAGLVASGLSVEGVLLGETLSRIWVDFTWAPVELRVVRVVGANGRGEN